jgi:dTDP-4-dehydrorhamnose reductase
MTRVAVLGSKGMLGHALVRVFIEYGFEVVEVNRNGLPVISGSSAIRFNPQTQSVDELANLLSKCDYIVNAIGIIRQVFNKHDTNSVLSINRDFPRDLSLLSANSGLRVIQIATDCVFSGKEGNYLESSPHNPVDLYGSSKSQGEKLSPEIMHVRTSIIGRELSSKNSLMEWFISQPSNSTVNGFVNHRWNGVTTLHFGRVVAGILLNNKFSKGTSHLIPLDIRTKYEMVNFFRRCFARLDLVIDAYVAPEAIDRSLNTINPKENSMAWSNAGYQTIPTIEEMVLEYARWDSEWRQRIH